MLTGTAASPASSSATAERVEEEFNIHPNQLKSLAPGVAAVLSRGTQRKALVQVDRSGP